MPPDMGYVSKDIADITEPDIVTLSAQSNFVQFASKPGDKTYLKLSIEVKLTPGTVGSSRIRIADASGTLHTFDGTTVQNEVTGNKFYVAADPSDTAENLRQTLLSDEWFGSRFEAVIPFVWRGTNPTNGTIIHITGKGAGTEFNMQLLTPDDPEGDAYTVTWINRTSHNNDSISGEEPTAEINLDVYGDPDVFLGQNDRPTSPEKMGHYLVTLSKTYAGRPLWFDLNALFSQYIGYNLPVGVPGWFDTGTLQKYRFAAKIKAVNSFYFYQSNALFVLHGYGPASEDLVMDRYVYRDGGTVRLLTNKPRTPYVRGQREFINFIFEDSQRGIVIPEEFTLRVAYQAYTTGGDLLGTVYGQEQARRYFAIVNTCRLNIDSVLDQFPRAGIIRVALARDTSIVSNYVEYAVRPECLHTLRQFSFINRLGGWDTFNFDAEIKEAIKPGSETYNKTVTPSYRQGDSIETVYSTTLADTFTVEGAPVTDAVAEWLKELAASRVVLDGDGNYVIIEDFTLPVSPDNRDMQIPTIKYRLSETYTNE